MSGVSKVLAVFGLIGLTATAQSVGAQTQVTVAEARQLAPRAVEQGNLPLAEQLGLALIQENPNDINGNVTLAQVYLRTGRADAARTRARAAYRVASNPFERFTTAKLMAETHIARKAYERAKFWLRIASQNAETPQQEQFIARLFQQVRAVSPWRTNLSFNLTPSDNVNNGTDETTIEFCLNATLCLPADLDNAEPLSGVILRASGSASYKIVSTPQRQVHIGADLSHQHVELVGDDRDDSIYRGSDFNTTYVGGHINERSVLGNSGFILNTRAAFGRTWIIRPQVQANQVTARPSAFTDRVQLSFTAQKTLRANRRISVGFDTQFDDDNSDSIRSSKRNAVRFTDEYILANRDALSYTLTASVTDSRFANTAHDAKSVTLRYTPARQFANVGTSFSLTLGDRKNKLRGLFRQPRNDTSISLTASFKFNDMNLFGFAPKAQITARQTQSNISLFETKQLQASINLETRF